MFVRVRVTNALGPMRAVERIGGLVTEDGLIEVMSSGQGSIGNNTNGQRELYGGSKAALDMLMRSFALRHALDRRARVLRAPRWVRTERGGPDARLSIAESIPKGLKTLRAARTRPGLQYLDDSGRTVPW